jgi:enoyl-CoA hydratase/carnithine racemase
MGEGRISYAAAGGIATLTLDQPERLNAMTLAMWCALPDAVAQAADDPDVRVLVLTGAGDRAFCAGADISQFGTARTGEDAVAAYDAAVAAGSAAVLQADKPTVAAIRGICFGGGLALAMACDLRFAAAGSRFRLPAARLGLGYGFDGLRLLVQRLGPTVAADVVLSARIIPSDEASGMGLVNQIWPADAFETRLAAYLAAIVANAPLTLRAMKRGLKELARPEAEQDGAAVDALVAACFASEDYREGQAAFREKRDPVFRGR